MTDSLALPPLTLVLGGQRSGKSAHAERLMAGGGVYLATGHASDDEMAARIQAHQDRRADGWATVEEPLDLVAALARAHKLHAGRPVLVDSLGMWVANMLHAGRAPVLEAEALADAMRAHPAPVVAVAEDVGQGLVPMNAVGRAFIDALGLVNQMVAAKAARVVAVHAGLPLVLKNET
ncbi:MAG: bifunctional adenosylcobinamide kinase/adenosylcobinamide-phosphate guanylyltransferase [Alphaproteobacteria bacterium]|nr:bifunctional adenosylcobinamide kinase/adenosylcobinamide-phosphate guanylyltransferase [Alphaproteobacteria bacterium]